MRNPSLLLLIVVFILAPFKLSAAADTVVVRETRIPVLIERQDNAGCRSGRRRRSHRRQRGR